MARNRRLRTKMLMNETRRSQRSPCLDAANGGCWRQFWMKKTAWRLLFCSDVRTSIVLALFAAAIFVNRRKKKSTRPANIFDGDVRSGSEARAYGADLKKFASVKHHPKPNAHSSPIFAKMAVNHIFSALLNDAAKLSAFVHCSC